MNERGYPDTNKKFGFAEYLKLRKLRDRYRSLDSMLISVTVHIILFLVLSCLAVDTMRSSKDEVPVDFAKVRDVSVRHHRPPGTAPARDFAREERGVKSLADRVSKRDVQSPKLRLATKRLDTRVEDPEELEMATAADIPISDTDRVPMALPREAIAMGASTGKPEGSSLSRQTERDGGVNGLSIVKPSSVTVASVPTPGLDQISRLGLVELDPMNMVPALTFRRKSRETVVFLLDISGSMEGDYRRPVFGHEWSKKLKRARRSIVSSLCKLRPGKDKFHVMAFSSDIKSFRKEPVDADEQNITEAIEFVRELSPVGWERTDLYDAIIMALEMEPERIILVTDGLPTEGTVNTMSILRDVRQRNKGTRIYTFATNLPFREEKARKFLSLLATQNSGRFSDDRMGLPRGLALSTDGHIYIADSTVKVFSNAGRHVRSFGPNTIKVAVDNSGDVHLLFYQHIADSGFGALGICQADGTQLDRFAEYGFTPQQMDMPWGIATDSQKRTYVTCTNLSKVIIFDSTGKFVRSFGSSGIRAHQVDAWRGDRLYPHEEHIRREGIRSSKCGFFAGPMDVAVDLYDNIYVLDSGNFRIQVFNSQITFIREFPIHGSGIAMTVDRTGNYIYVLTGLMKHTGGDEICIHISNGELVERFAIDAGTSDIDVDSSGNIYTLNFVDDKVNVFSSQGEKLGSFSTVP